MVSCAVPASYVTVAETETKTDKSQQSDEAAAWALDEREMRPLSPVALPLREWGEALAFPAQPQ